MAAAAAAAAATDGVAALALAADAEQLRAPVSVRCFSEETPSDGRLDFQVVDLGRQLYVWVALGGARMPNLCFSIATAERQGGAPATAVLLRGNAGASGEGLAQRLGEREREHLGGWGGV